MVTKQFHISVALLALVALASAAVSAGQVDLRKAKPVKILVPTHITLKILWVVPLRKGRVSVINNTSSPIPKDTTIYWSINDKNYSKKGSFTLYVTGAGALLPNRPFITSEVVDFTGIEPPNIFNPWHTKAWYYK